MPIMDADETRIAIKEVRYSPPRALERLSRVATTSFPSQGAPPQGPKECRTSGLRPCYHSAVCDPVIKSQLASHNFRKALFGANLISRRSQF